ncbi:MAG: SUMF1/EgtB/PvdO family nonheme iron enzyme [Thermoguttaceae bacterium]|nr:SUMF1/EgtB/PvdO family nonheme iron enzyme [Thermoguttaceae bacterium]
MKKQALLIGINQYQILPELKYARQDAEAVEQALKQNYCFSDDEVMLLTDARPGLFKPTNSLIILSHLEKLANQELDLFIFGFWGHGVVRNGKRYLCPLDVMPSAVEKLGVPFDELMNHLSKIRAKNTCLILDCCQKVHDRGEEEVFTSADQTAFENAARDIVLRRKETTPEFVSNVAILNSCKEGQAAYEWDNRKHGIFTAHLLDAMNRRFDSVAQIVGYVSHNVEKTAMELGKTQTPLCRLEGDIPLPVDTKSTPLVTGNVFISYRHCNADLVAPVEEELKKRGISYFIDRVGVNYGMEYSEALTQALKASKVLLFFWTKDAKGSTDLFREVKMALDLKKRVIPYKIGAFNAIEHDSLYYQLSPLSRYEVAAQTPETVIEIVNRVEQALSGKSHVTLNLPESSEDAVIEKIVFEKRQQTPLEVLPKQPQETVIQKKDTEKSPITVDFIQPKKQNNSNWSFWLCCVIAGILVLPPIIGFVYSLIESSVEKSKQRQHAMIIANAQYEMQQKTRMLRIGSIAGERITITVNGAEFAFRWCPAGTFTMGAQYYESGREKDETPHTVTLTKGFWMMETEVTNKQWEALMEYSHRSPNESEYLPIESVSWKYCKDFCLKTGLKLPTEAQWEYACRAGSTNTRINNLDEIAWYKSNSYDCTQQVGTKKPNAWGLYDMLGNVWEWCADWYEDYQQDNVIDPTGPSSGISRVNRGGSYKSRSEFCRPANRNRYRAEDSYNDVGFRCVIVP